MRLLLRWLFTLFMALFLFTGGLPPLDPVSPAVAKGKKGGKHKHKHKHKHKRKHKHKHRHKPKPKHKHKKGKRKTAKKRKARKRTPTKAKHQRKKPKKRHALKRKRHPRRPLVRRTLRRWDRRWDRTRRPYAYANGYSYYWNNSGTYVYQGLRRLEVPVPQQESILPYQMIDWLVRAGSTQGWKRVSALEAQRLANQDWAVVAGWKNPDGSASETSVAKGFVAQVLPDPLNAANINARGPRIQLAGGNSKSPYVKAAFPPAAWTSGQIVYLAHKTAKSR